MYGDSFTEIYFNMKTVSASLTRPADTTQYAVADALTDSTSAPTALNFEKVGQSNGQKVSIVGAMITSTAKQTTLPQLDLWLFKTAPTATNDNSAFALTDAHNDECVGIVEFDSWKYSANNSRSDVNTINLPVELDQDDLDLYGLLVLKNTYTPVSGETFKVSLKVERHKGGV